MNDAPEHLWIALPPGLSRPEIVRAFEVLGKENLRFVGGCVRDALLDIHGGDVDLATTLPPETVMAMLAAEGIKVIPTGLKHGTVTAVIGGVTLEITTLRRDVSTDGRHAEVEFTDCWEEDAARRDFTINAMSLGIDGKLHDYFDGLNDLEEGIIRFVGDAAIRVQEDYLRILRFFRFYARFGLGEMNAEALAACRQHAASLAQLSGERIQTEMLKMLATRDPVTVLNVMRDQEILPQLIPGVQHFDMLGWLIVLEKRQNLTVDPVLRLAALLRPLANARMAALWINDRWRLSNKMQERLLRLSTESLTDIETLPPAAQKKQIRRFGKSHFRDLVMLAWAELLTQKGASLEAVRDQFMPLLQLVEEWQIPEFPLDGKDLLKLGIRPSKELGALLAQAEEWWETEGYAPDHAALLAWVKDRYMSSSR